MSKHIASSQDMIEVRGSSCQAMDNGDEQLELPPGFRFHPTDEELITHYLSKKFIDNTFNATAVGEVDLNKCEPWDLPWRAKMGEKEWYFFCVRDRKYPTGSRANRATESGYWKATGKDKEIHRDKSLVGMKKTLVFYKGRAPRGEKTNWVMHEYRLEGKLPHHSLPKISKSEWVICRVFKKSSTGKKTPIIGLYGANTLKEELSSSMMPPLIEAPFGNHASFFSNGSLDGLKNMHNNDMIDHHPFINPSSTNHSDASFSSLYMQTPNSTWMQDHGLLRSLLHEPNGLKQTCKPETDLVGTSAAQDLNPEISQLMSSHQMGRRCLEDHDLATGPLEMEYLWNY